jgi:hypothetical protein
MGLPFSSLTTTLTCTRRVVTAVKLQVCCSQVLESVVELAE